MKKLEDLFEKNLKSIVERPDEIEVSITKTTKDVKIVIKSNKDDHGRIIGKNGRTIDALRIIGSAMKAELYPSDRRKFIVELLEENDFNRRQ